MTFYKLFKWGGFITSPGKFPRTPTISIIRNYRKNHKDQFGFEFSILGQWVHLLFYISKPKEEGCEITAIRI